MPYVETPNILKKSETRGTYGRKKRGGGTAQRQDRVPSWVKTRAYKAKSKNGPKRYVD
jgi:hypothetical protein